ncbi:KpsF/GutQ family sugar-phosphate isomerase [Methyloligella sp. 2.7D]|uniref:KpsF/GutQ family sugar-phosphate isomerase n=1 Tax=unclassified Methyloligella TaxID=2625955 RepID=UPI00157BF40C|nr:KpsF/GutQ family sugar-phosphate isomerase [Methyloligella sp. GL2]QKP78712.1 KpsF/GutQ family sugar-phosphate isomerase [Methyloligella sp. GL2]
MTGAESEAAQGAEAIASATRTLALEIQGLSDLKAAIGNGLGDHFARAVELMRNCEGRIIVTGLGKSGHIGVKVAATLSSTGTPAFFVHPTEASHGDLGMITKNDVILAFSWSGETMELGNLVSYSGRFTVPLIAVTSNPNSTLAEASDVVLALPNAKEACPLGLAPTTSTAMQLALGDSLAIALLESKRFTAEDFKEYHPGGRLGAKLKFVGDLMHKAERLPIAGDDTPMAEALVIMTEKAFGCLGVVDSDGQLVGIITDGDLRRHMGNDLLQRRTGEIMTADPKTITPEIMASAALEVINSRAITALFVVENDRRPVGILHVHDLLRAGVV